MRRRVFLKEAVPMPKPGRKADHKHIGFRVPLDLYNDYLTVAEARGIDLTALLNWVLAEFRPVLLLKHAQHQAAMLRVHLIDPYKSPAEDGQESAALASANSVLQQMEQLAAILQNRPVNEEARRTA
jgi:hypothetical protein